MPTLIDFGGNPGRSPIQDRQTGFISGLNNAADPATLLPTQAFQMTNFRLNFAAAQKRLGTQRTTASANSTGRPVAGGAYWAAYNTFVYFDQGGKIFLDAGFTFQASIGAPTIDNNSGVCAFVAGSQTPVIYIADAGTTKLYKYDFSSWSTVWTGTAKISRMVVYNSRLWGWDFTASSGGVSTTGALYYSNLSTASASVGGDSLAVGASSGGQINVQTFGLAQIISCIVVGASLMILHVKGVSRLTGFGQSDITVTPQSVSDSDTVVGPDAVCETDGVAYFASTRGLVQMTEGALNLVASPASPDPLPQAFVTCLANGGTPSNTRVVYSRFRKEVWILVPTVGTFIYSTILNAWAGPWDGPYNVGSSAYPVAFSATGDTLFVGDQANNYMLKADAPGFAVYKDLVHSDSTGGAAFNGILQCHRMFGGSAYVAGTETTLPVGSGTAKSWRMVNILATLTSGATAPTCTMASVYGGSITATLTTLASAEQTYYLPAGGAGPYIDVTITDGGSTGPSQYASVDVSGFALGIR